MKAVVVNSIVYSLSLRRSFARACLGIRAGLRWTGFGERGVHEISTVVYVNAQFSVPVSHTLGCRVWRYKVRSQECTHPRPPPRHNAQKSLGRCSRGDA
jgi:hypothetical protein